MLHGASMKRSVFADHQVGVLGFIWLLAIWKENADARQIPDLIQVWDHFTSLKRPGKRQLTP